MKAARHRLGQGIGALLAFARSPDLALAGRHLSPVELAAFRAMSRADQLHSLGVLRALLRADPGASAILIKAALLHDVGKSRCHLAVWQKSLAVLMMRFAPGFCERLSQSQSLSRWRAPHRVHRYHAKWSGEILREMGADATLIWLAEHHHHEPARVNDERRGRMLAALKAADGGG